MNFKNILHWFLKINKFGRALILNKSELKAFLTFILTIYKFFKTIQKDLPY